MKSPINIPTALLFALIVQSLLLSCSKKENPEPVGLANRDFKFDGVYIARDARLNPSLPDHRYIQFDGWFARLRNGGIFQDNTLSLIVSGSGGKVNIKTDFLPAGSAVPGLSSSQHARVIYVEVDNKKIYFSYYAQDQSHRALRADNVQGNSVEPWGKKENHWIIHDFSANNAFKWVAIESAFERGWFIMNAGTLNGDTRIRLMERSANNATKWEIHKP